MLITSVAQIVVALSVTFLWLYLNGNEYTTLTGGWMAQAWAGGSGWTATAPSLNKYSDLMLIYLTGTYSTYSGVVRATNKVDLSAVARIRVTLSASLSGPKYHENGGQTLYLMATSANSGYWPWGDPSASGVIAEVHDHTSYGTSETPPSETLTDVQYLLDVSGIPDGSYYVSVAFLWYNQYKTSNVTIKSVEMLAA